METKEELSVSFIVPVYNGERYLQRCIDSIKKQTNDNWRLFIIDDGSKDGTASICKKNAEEDLRIRYYRQENQGVSVARNNGIVNATGQIISFVDADDMISDNMVETILSNWELDMDILLFDYYRVENGVKESKKFIVKEGRCTPDELILNTCFVFEDEASQNQNNATPWGKAFRREFLLQNSLFFKQNMFLCEDRVFNLECYKRAKNIIHISVPMYEYFINELSVTTKTNKGKQEYVERVIENFDEYMDAISHILIDEQCRSVLYSRAVCNEYVYVVKLILWMSEAVEGCLKQELWKYSSDIVKRQKLMEHLKDLRLQDRVLIWLCDKQMFKLIQSIITLRKNR